MKGSPCVFLINNEYLELKWQIYGSPITTFPSMKDREGIIAPVSLSCQPGSIYRKPAPPEPLQMAESASKWRTGPVCHTHFKLVTSCLL